MGSFVRTGASSIQGQGLFATQPLSTGDVILTLDTSRVVDEERPLRAEKGESEEHLAYLEGGKVVLLPEPERHLNHSCDPNAYLRTSDGSTRLLARRRITVGEEVTIDYLINTHGGSSWRCRCGADRCRGELETSFFDLPLSFRREYLPLLEDWFVAEHRERVEKLRRGIEEEGDEGA